MEKTFLLKVKDSKSVPARIDSLDPSVLGGSLIRVMDEVLEEVFCRPGKELIISLLKSNYGLAENDIPRRPEVFHRMLEDFFGASGRVIENMIVQKITHRKVELKEGVRHG